MNIDRIKITNFKKYEAMDLCLSPDINILVGDNDAGKSTILEAIDLALSGLHRGRYIKGEISQSLFNIQCVKSFLDSMRSGKKQRRLKSQLKSLCQVRAQPHSKET